MALARPYFSREPYKDWDRERLITALIEAETQLMEANIGKGEAELRADHNDPWYGTGQPMPYVPADGQW